jgi:hypothetical protein
MKIHTKNAFGKYILSLKYKGEFMFLHLVTKFRNLKYALTVNYEYVVRKILYEVGVSLLCKCNTVSYRITQLSDFQKHRQVLAVRIIHVHL